MNPSQLYEFLLNTLQPKYEKQFGTEHRKDLMNVSSLVAGMKSYIYHWNERKAYVPTKLSFALMRGQAIHYYISQKLSDQDKHEILWKLPYAWKDGTKDITLIGHYDNTLPVADSVLAEWKSTGQDNVWKNGLLLRAKRQLGTYATIQRYKTGIDYEAFIILLNTELGFTKLPPVTEDRKSVV